MVVIVETALLVLWRPHARRLWQAPDVFRRLRRRTDIEAGENVGQNTQEKGSEKKLLP